MSKRAHSAVDSAGPRSSDSKRSRRHSSTSTSLKPPLSLEGSLSEEVLLRVLSFLDVGDLMRVSLVSSAWHRLAQDGQLWRPLYLSTFASSSSRSSSYAELSQRGSPLLSMRSRPWRDLYKISSNWRRGSARAKNLIGPAVRKTILAEAPGSLALAEDAVGSTSGLRTASGPSNLIAGGSDRPIPRPTPPTQRINYNSANERPESDLLLQFRGRFFLTAPRKPAALTDEGRALVPAVSVLQTLPEGGSVLVGTIRSPSLSAYWESRGVSEEGLSVTELRLDETHEGSSSSQGSVKLAVFLSTGQWSIFTLQLPNSSHSFWATEVFWDLVLSTPQASFRFNIAAPPMHHLSAPQAAFDPVVLARWSGRILVTFSQQSVLRFWTVRDLMGGAVEVSEGAPSLRTHECFAPVVLNLHKLTTSAYEDQTTIHPHHWPAGPEARRGKEDGEEVERFRVSVAYATPVFPSAWTVGLQEFDVDLESSSTSSSTIPGKMATTALRMKTTAARHSVARVQAGGDHSLVTAIEYAAPFLVASRNNNTIDVYEALREGACEDEDDETLGRQQRSRSRDEATRSATGQQHSKTFKRRAGSTLSSHSRGGKLRMKGDATPPPEPILNAAPGPLPHRHLHKDRAAAPPSLELVHRRTLFGHTGSVQSVALRGDKCVSGGADGAVKVWDLTALERSAEGERRREGKRRRRSRAEEGVVTVTEERSEQLRERSVKEGQVGMGFAREEERRPGRVERVWFDEAQIVSVVEGEGVRLLAFD